MALVALSVVEQRLDAVRAVLAGAQVTEVAASVGVSRQTVHSWVQRYLTGQARGRRGPRHLPHDHLGGAQPQGEQALAYVRGAWPLRDPALP